MSSWTLSKKLGQQMELLGLDDKRQIAAVF